MPATLIPRNHLIIETAHKWITSAPPDTVVTFKKPGRTISQNDRMWAMLSDIATQVNHLGRKYSADMWKLLMMNACGYEVQFITGLSGEPFPIGFRSSKLTKEQMGELMEFMACYGAEKGVIFNEPN